MRRFEEQTNLRFRHFGLLRQAFTHPSYYSHRQGGAACGGVAGGGAHDPSGTHDGATTRLEAMPHNQRLEYLGDAVLQLASADYLFHHCPETHDVQVPRLGL